ncbi:MAG: type II/IV secretion system protein [Betaproteobacteria bacterium]|nr:type II/IV secretion system protein [Betaproteobacteria bacterium]
MVHEDLRAASDGVHRRCHRRHRGAHVSADLRVGGEHSVKPLDFDPAFRFGADDLSRARELAAKSGRRVVACLEETSGLGEDAFLAALGVTLSRRVLSMAELHAAEPAYDLLPYAEALAHECALLRDPGGQLMLAYADPFETRIRVWADERVAAPFEPVLVRHDDLVAWLARQGDSLRAMESLVVESRADAESGKTVEDLSLKSISAATSPVIRLVHSTLYDALKSGASDIHLETGAAGLIIKYRIDGVLSNVSQVNGLEMAEQVISRIKVMSELDIAERRVPQDGRFKVSVQRREIDFRVSIMPSIFGEDAVLRILDKQSLADQVKGLSLDSLGFDEAAKTWLRRLSSEPYGMLLVTGPTGSGKTTTLYAAISEINHGHDKLITIEDPVEYQLPGVLQIPVNEKKGLTFARGLRSILRHDPDKIMVGEIRDSETAQIAIQAALTGHLVFTTVHANNVFDVLGRFTHMGVDPYSFVSALNGIVAQRLVRVNCAHCAADDEPSDELLADSGLTRIAVHGYRFRAGTGCGHCRGTGFRGRKAIAEMLVLTDELREMITSREPIRRIKDAARRSGTAFLRDSALALVASGETTLQEINRVTLVA